MRRMLQFFRDMLRGPQLRRDNERLRTLLLHYNLNPPQRGTRRDAEISARRALEASLPVGFHVDDVELVASAPGSVRAIARLTHVPWWRRMFR